MYQHFETHFGFALDPSPNDMDVNRLIQIQVMTGLKDRPEGWRAFGAKFPATQLDDLIHALQHAKKVLDTECKKTPEGYWPRRRAF